jgi:hypothetical protein
MSGLARRFTLAALLQQQREHPRWVPLARPVSDGGVFMRHPSSRRAGVTVEARWQAGPRTAAWDELWRRLLSRLNEPEPTPTDADRVAPADEREGGSA